ncbi:hypothetical protein [Burkholderia anthina]|uniref:hypothetical protein n=1 Tax=Burkholderia anthina TaxID=179879 RepID=UPI00075DE21A|nr:hypothetical protein [Burkholderia anthina]KWH61604.1 hypothetical protein WT63_18780 [Burkholderia anthina]
MDAEQQTALDVSDAVDGIMTEMRGAPPAAIESIIASVDEIGRRVDARTKAQGPVGFNVGSFARQYLCTMLPLNADEVRDE